MLLSPAVRNIRGSEEKAGDRCMPSTFRVTGVEEATSHSVMLFAPVLTRVVPSGEKANELISPLDALRDLSSDHFRLCESYDHNLIVWSSLAHARYLPSGEKTNAFSACG